MPHSPSFGSQQASHPTLESSKRSRGPWTVASLLTEAQPRLWAFLFSVIADPERARDVLQETNRVLWERAAEYDAARPFLGWAIGVARTQALAERQRSRRDRLQLDPDVAEGLAEIAEARAEGVAERQLALAQCLNRLTPEQRCLLERRYAEGLDLNELGRSLHRSANAVAATLMRVRRALAICIRDRLAAEELR
jgi:RNA polymerase sigma-70 factor (ECF subfamily)